MAFKNAFTQYDNVVEMGESHQVTEQSIKDVLSNTVKEMSSSAITNLNKLTSFGANSASSGSKGNSLLNTIQDKANASIDKAKSKLSEITSKIPDTSKLSDMLKDMTGGNIPDLGNNPALDKVNELMSKASDFTSSASKLLNDISNNAISQLKNSNLTYAMNIIEDFVDDLKRSVYITDRMFLEQLSFLHKHCGADLGYNNNAIRIFALDHDLVETLQYVDKELPIPIKYKISYKDLERDLQICVDNNCWKCMRYIFHNLYIEYINHELEYNETKYQLTRGYYSTPESHKIDQYGYEECLRLNEIYETEMNKIEHIFLKYFKDLIVYSYSYVNVSALKHFFDCFPKILLPKYFGSTDDRFHKYYAFTEKDCEIMMPPIENNKEEETTETTEEPDTNTCVIFNIASNAVNNSPLASLRNSLYANQDKKEVSKLNTVNAGSTAIKVAEVAKNVIKKASENPYITYRNENIKQIYAYLSSEVIFGYNRMVNDNFHERTSIKSNINILKTAIIEAGTVFGNNYILQAVNNVIDATESSGYKLVEKYKDSIFEPKTSKPVDEISYNYDEIASLNDLSLKRIADYIENAQKIIDKQNEQDIKGIEDTIPAAGNPQDIKNVKEQAEELEDLIAKNTLVRSKLASIFQFIDEIPTLTLRDMCIRYYDLFYTLLSKLTVNQREHVYERFVYNTIGVKDQTSNANIKKIINNIVLKYVKMAFRNIMAVYYLNYEVEFLELKSFKVSEVENITSLFRIMAGILIREVQSTGFTKTVFNYDHDYLSILARKIYLQELKHLGNVSNPSNWLNDKFADELNNFAAHFTGFPVPQTDEEWENWSADSVVYNIEGFLYGTSDYQLQKILNDYTGKKYETFTREVTKLVEDNTKTIDELLETVDEELEIIDRDNAENIQESGIFAEIFTFAESSIETDSEKAEQNLEAVLMLLYSIDSNDNIVDLTTRNSLYNFSIIKSRYMAKITETRIKNNTNSDGTDIEEEVGTSEWNVKNNYPTDDFRDSDESSENFYKNVEEKEKPEYVVFDINNINISDTNEFLARKYGIALFYKLTATISAGGTVNHYDYYYKTTYDDEIIWRQTHPDSSRDLAVLKRDLDIILKYK